MKAEEEQLPVLALKSLNARLEQISGHVIVERPLGRIHRVIEEPRLAVHERLLEKALRLSPKRALQTWWGLASILAERWGAEYRRCSSERRRRTRSSAR